MKRSHSAPSVTSLPLSPQVESDHRVRKYMITMIIRTTCFVLMAVVQPYGWWTWLFAAAAIFLPYVAVVDANAGAESTDSTVESPREQLTMAASEPVAEATPAVITIQENRGDAPAPEPDGEADAR